MYPASGPNNVSVNTKLFHFHSPGQIISFGCILLCEEEETTINQQLNGGPHYGEQPNTSLQINSDSLIMAAGEIKSVG